eukprot:4607496-Lingulodinium_polyedra.AAC.1
MRQRRQLGGLEDDLATAPAIGDGVDALEALEDGCDDHAGSEMAASDPDNSGRRGEATAASQQHQ